MNKKKIHFSYVLYSILIIFGIGMASAIEVAPDKAGYFPGDTVNIKVNSNGKYFSKAYIYFSGSHLGKNICSSSICYGSNNLQFVIPKSISAGKYKYVIYDYITKSWITNYITVEVSTISSSNYNLSNSSNYGLLNVELTNSNLNSNKNLEFSAKGSKYFKYGYIYTSDNNVYKKFFILSSCENSIGLFCSSFSNNSISLLGLSAGNYYLRLYDYSSGRLRPVYKKFIIN